MKTPTVVKVGGHIYNIRKWDRRAIIYLTNLSPISYS